MPAEPITLRGHHLLCVLTYIGKGYTQAFTDNFDAIAARINNQIRRQGKAKIQIVTGPDPICAALRQGSTITCSHAKICRGNSVKMRDRRALQDVGRVLRQPSLRTGHALEIGIGEIRLLRLHFRRKAIRRACVHCPWYGFCSQIAAGGYHGVRLLPEAVA